MSKIRVLPDSLANKIAAGEVVERPASIVKELLENSIDARAARIEVTIESGGRRLIRVSDDGEGMTRDDAVLAFERHATSKIKSAEDLEAILTLGFRGEALASIASVAKVRLRTQTAEDMVGVEIEIAGGRMIDVRPTAFTRGAEFEIRDLFFNVPARRKFLKSEATESFHIANLVTHYALAYPHLSFTLINQNRESIRTTPAADLRERAYQLFGEKFIADLIEVRGESGSLKVEGFVSSPSAVRATRDNQYFFVNRRFVRDKLLSGALSESYRAMVPSGSHPSAMLFVELPPEEVDVNVHPAKTEVRFVRASIVRDMVRDAVRAGIQHAKPAATPMSLPAAKQPADDAPPLQRVAAVEPEPKPASSPQPHQAEQQKIILEPEPLQAESSGQMRFDPQPLDPEEIGNISGGEAVETSNIHYGNRLGCLGGSGSSDASLLKPASNLTLHADEINLLGQLHQSFIIAADRSGLLLIDQHVAHERILFEQHWTALRRGRIEVQRLLLPETLDLSPAQASAFDQLLPELEENGFELSRLSGRTIAVQAVPAMLRSGAAQSLLVELLDAIETERRSLSIDELRAEIAASLACRAAVKIHMQLSEEKSRWLVDELLRMENPATCPHGRPIVLRITMRDIERGFQR
ncbi:MAG: DNA mismatch repair endonuclease MutL [Blastocatellales bacterium]|nr:DNA mismatch repair endonuclease MutL [Blastocatellales bacterium]